MVSSSWKSSERANTELHFSGFALFSVKIVHFYSYADDSSCLSGLLFYLIWTEGWVVGTTKNCSDIMLHDSSLSEFMATKRHDTFEKQYGIH
jgi:hypothetical protein